MSITILPYSKRHKESFRTLNEEWLNKFFALEPIDVQLLSDPEKHIIDPGGYIFFAEYHGAIVGTVALIPHGENIFELGKMAVTESIQGLGVGKELLKYSISFAKTSNAKKLIL
ncbi:MAG: GNAT family N-acetyltransferase, partial [Bacteroidetes bacterium]|nr:GNAT family N-acetyltransferase [Bacteroidota bacterium]